MWPVTQSPQKCCYTLEISERITGRVTAGRVAVTQSPRLASRYWNFLSGVTTWVTAGMSPVTQSPALLCSAEKRCHGITVGVTAVSLAVIQAPSLRTSVLFAPKFSSTCNEYERVRQPLNIPFSSSLPSRLALSIRNNSGASTMVAAMAEEVGWRLVKLRDNGDGGLRCHHAPPAKAAQQWRACYGVLLPCCDSEKQSKRSWPTVLPLPPPSPARAVRGGDDFDDPWLLSPTTSWTTATVAFSSGGARQRHGSAVCLSPFGAGRMQRCGVTDSRPPSE
nr:hypothetical protein Iba_chr12aCG10360 [Ipomoea batatas]